MSFCDRVFPAHGESGSPVLLWHQLPTPNWEEFVQLTCSEIRLYGAENFQIARRMRAILESLAVALPEYRKPELTRELELLDRMIEKVYLLPEDAAIARVSDTQGLGGAA
jgi:uncharacterized membrane protein